MLGCECVPPHIMTCRAGVRHPPADSGDEAESARGAGGSGEFGVTGDQRRIEALGESDVGGVVPGDVVALLPDALQQWRNRHSAKGKRRQMWQCAGDDGQTHDASRTARTAATASSRVTRVPSGGW